MPELIATLNQMRRLGAFCAMIYLQEAHADDLWPLGYGVRKHCSELDRQEACARFFEDRAELQQAFDVVAVDTMDDHFLHAYGAWPERYFLADLSGKVLWASQVSVVTDCRAMPSFDHGFEEAIARASSGQLLAA